MSKEPTFEPNAEPSLEPSSRPFRSKDRKKDRKRNKKPWWFWLLVAMFSVLLALGASSGGLWWWLGQPSSLGRSLEFAQRWMPEDQQLEFEGVRGSVRYGGTLERILWQSASAGLKVEVRSLALDWALTPLLLAQNLYLDRLEAKEIEIHQTPLKDEDPEPQSPPQPPETVQLPFFRAIDLPVQVQKLSIIQAQEDEQKSINLNDLRLRYRYDTDAHNLHLENLRDEQGGQHSANITLEATPQMQLVGELQSQIRSDLAGAENVNAHLNLEGSLAGEEALLNLSGNLRTPETLEIAPSANAQIYASIKPWKAAAADVPLPERLKIELENFNLAQFLPELVSTDLHGYIHAEPSGESGNEGGAKTLALNLELENRRGGAWDQGALPLERIKASASAQLHETEINDLQIEAFLVAPQKGGEIQANFTMGEQGSQLRAQIADVNPARFLSTLPTQALSGTATAAVQISKLEELAAELINTPAELDIAISDSSDASDIQGGVQVRGAWEPDKQSLRFDQLEANIFGALLSAQGELGAKSGQGKLQLELGAIDKIQASVEKLPGVTPLGMHLRGAAQIQAQWQGGWEDLRHLQVQAHIPHLQNEEIELRDFRLLASGAPRALVGELSATLMQEPRQVQLHSQWQISADFPTLPDWSAAINSLTLYVRPQESGGDWQLQLQEPLRLAQRGAVLQAEAASLLLTPPSTPSLPAQTQSSEPATIRWSQLRLDGNGQLQTEGSLEELPLAWVDILSPDPQEPLLANAGISGDLVLRGHWDIDLGKKPRINARLERARGDVRLAAAQEDLANVTVVRSSGADSAEQTMRRQGRRSSAARGQRVRLQNLHLQLGLEQEQLTVQGIWASERAGTILIEMRSPLEHRAGAWLWPEDAPISGNIQSSLPDIGLWGMFVPAGWRIVGNFSSDVILSGTRSQPQWAGELWAQDFGVSSLLEGVNLKNGKMHARFAGNRVDLQELRLEAGANNQARILGQSGNRTESPTSGGHLSASGHISYEDEALEMDIGVRAEGLQVLIRADRQVGISGDIRAQMGGGNTDDQLKISGKLVVDRAALLLADESAPELDDDVSVTSKLQRQIEADKKAAQERRAARQPPPEGSMRASLQPKLDIQIDLGSDFALQGYGITTRLGGQLRLADGLNLTGQIYTDQGRFRAWGQSLDVEKGIISFHGAYDNPSLDITALRPNVPVRVGAKVQGSASAPRVLLFSEPQMPDAAKLGWIITGRDPEQGGTESALVQQAALALLSDSQSNFAGNVGLDEIGFSGEAITLGKRISQDLYLVYEQSLSGAMGTLFVFYDLGRRLTLRGQTGTQTALDLIYTQYKD